MSGYAALAGDEPMIIVTAYPDFCGSGVFQKIVPDFVDGIYIGGVCAIHDDRYSPGSSMSRVDADVEFFYNIQNTLINNGMDPARASANAFIYFTGVRAAGGFFYDGNGTPF